MKATGYVTMAERPLDPADYPEADPALLVPGSLVFTGTRGPVRLDDYRQWWRYVPGASWKAPEGPGSNLAGRDRHPVTHVAAEDVDAYATWAGKALPTEAEWEFAARGGLDQKAYVWGDEHSPKGRAMANVWQGEFPWQNTLDDGFLGTAPVKSFPPNGYGLFDMAGNVWEWTADFYTPEAPGRGRAPVLRAAQPADRVTGRVVRPRRPRLEHPAAGDQGRLAPVRAELLPALSAGRAPGRGRRHEHGPHRLPLHRAGRGAPDPVRRRRRPSPSRP